MKTPLLGNNTERSHSAEIIIMQLCTYLNIDEWKLWGRNKGKSELERRITCGLKQFSVLNWKTENQHAEKPSEPFSVFALHAHFFINSTLELHLVVLPWLENMIKNSQITCLHEGWLTNKPKGEPIRVISFFKPNPFHPSLSVSKHVVALIAESICYFQCKLVSHFFSDEMSVYGLIPLKVVRSFEKSGSKYLYPFEIKGAAISGNRWTVSQTEYDLWDGSMVLWERIICCKGSLQFFWMWIIKVLNGN